MNAPVPATKPVKVKPLLRGVFHQVAFMVSLLGVALLVLAPSQGPFHLAGVVYGLSLAVMLGLSALYHRPMWTLKARYRLRKLDHSGIAVLIAGTYTPMAVYESGGKLPVGLWVMWTGALIALVFALAWSNAPRVLRSGVYVVLGLVALPVMLRLPVLIGWTRVCLLLAGAFIYVAGAVVYAFRWPNPRPAVFGYHEVFHLMVIAAAGLHYGVVLDLARG